MSSSDLIDGKNNAADRKERQENLKRRLEQQEKEREIMQKLGRIGGGAGRGEHHAGIVDQDVDPRVPRRNRLSRGAHTFQPCQVQLDRVYAIGQAAEVR